MNSDHPTWILERFLAHLREQDDALYQFKRTLNPNVPEPAYVALLEEALEQARVAAVTEAAVAVNGTPEVEPEEEPFYKTILSDATEITNNHHFDKSTRLDLITPSQLTPRSGPLNGPTPSDLVYVGRRLEVDVLSKNSKPVSLATVVIDAATQALCKGPNDAI